MERASGDHVRTGSDEINNELKDGAAGDPRRDVEARQVGRKDEAGSSADPREMQSVHRYASRIKSFLGWDSDLDSPGKRDASTESGADKDASDLKKDKAAERKLGGSGRQLCSREAIGETNSSVRSAEVTVSNNDSSKSSESNTAEARSECREFGCYYPRESNGADENQDAEKNNLAELYFKDNNKPEEQLDIEKENNGYPESVSGSDISCPASSDVDNLISNSCEINENIIYEKLINSVDFSDSPVLESGELQFKESASEIGKKSPVTAQDYNILATAKDDYVAEILNTEACTNEKSSQNRQNMEEYLIGENKRNGGLILNDEDSIIKDERAVSNQIPFEGVEDSSFQKNDSYCLTQLNASIGSDESFIDKTCESNQISENADSLYQALNENAPKDVEEINLRDLRRLSNAIVKEVIESAQQALEKRFSGAEDTDAVLETYNHSSGVFHEEIPTINQTSPRNSDKNGSYNKDQQRNRKVNAKDYPKTKKEKLSQKHQISKSSEKVIEELDEDTICGIGSFRPKWMQKWARAEVYVILYSIIGVLHGSYYSYLVGTLSTLEKRFAFRSKISGTIMMVDEITPLFLGVLIGYLGGKVHRPRLLATGMLLSGGCAIATAAPYFIYGPAQHLGLQSIRNETGTEYCRDTGLDPCVTDERPPTVAAVLFLMLGSFMKGFGNLAYYAVGLVYMDDNSKKRNTPIYLAVAFALRLLGPLLGFLMSSAFLKIYENPFEDPGYGPEDPRWIGAWWMGFVLQGILLFVFTIPISLFPRRLPTQSKTVHEESKYTNIREMLADLLSALKRLFKNPFYILVVLNDLMIIFGHFGHYIMLPKYMENQFRISASNASLISGPPALCSVIVSTLIGGFLMWRFKLSAKFLLAGMVLTELCLVVGFLVLMTPQCSPVEMFHYGATRNGLILESECNKDCDCSKTAFTPFCGPDGRTTFFSPCFAGCSTKIEFPDQMKDSSKQVFGNCSCVIGTDGLPGANITEGFCEDDSCWYQAVAYSSIMPVIGGLHSLFNVAHTMILLRSVNSEDKSIALGTFETIGSLLGFIPFPIAYGAIVDSACLIWEESCGDSGNCWFYDMASYNYKLHGASSAFCFLSTLFMVAMYILNARVRSLYEEEDGGDFIEKPIKLDTVSETVTKL